MKKFLFLTIVIACFVLAITGCGGGGASAGGGATPSNSVKIKVAWPTAKSRVIPIAANSIQVFVYKNETRVGAALIVRPDDGTRIEHLPLGNLVIIATAYASTDGTGTALAGGAVQQTFVEGVNLVSLTMDSTIDHLAISGGPSEVTAGDPISLYATAYDNLDNIVLLAPSDVTWTSENPSTATVSSEGVVSTLLAGESMIRATEGDSGKYAEVPVFVNLGISISPLESSIGIDETQEFTATVLGAENTNVNWSVEGDNEATINSEGLFSPEGVAGDYTVVATSVQDGSKSASAVIHVGSGSGIITIH